MFDNYPHAALKAKPPKVKKHWIIRLIKRQKIRLDIIIKRTRKKSRRYKIKIKRLMWLLTNPT